MVLLTHHLLLDRDRPLLQPGPTVGHHPGVDQRTAQGLFAEIGADMQVFATASRLVSWAAVCPGNHDPPDHSVGQDP